MKEIKNYKTWYEERFLTILQDKPADYYNNSGIPSYLHKNRLMSGIFWKRIGIVLSLIKDYPGKRILDFGCGGGILFKYLSEKGCSVTGCENEFFELSKMMAGEIDGNIKIHKDIGEVKNTRFDIIFALDVLEHMEDIGDCLKTFREISHEKTKIIISGPTENIFYKIGRYFAGFSGDYHKRSIYEVEKKMFQHNFESETIKKINSPFTLFRISIWTLPHKFVNGTK